MLCVYTYALPLACAGVLLERAQLERAAEACRRAGAWLVVDSTYEHFVYEPGRLHHCVSGDHVIHVFSFSKVHNLPFADQMPTLVIHSRRHDALVSQRSCLVLQLIDHSDKSPYFQFCVPLQLCCAGCLGGCIVGFNTDSSAALTWQFSRRHLSSKPSARSPQTHQLLNHI